MKSFRVLITLAVLMSVVSAGVIIVHADCQPNGSGGNDNITCTGTDTNGVNGGNGNDTITVEAGASVSHNNDAIAGGDGNDYLVNNGTITATGVGFADGLQGNSGNDTLINNGTIIAGGNGMECEGNTTCVFVNTGAIEAIEQGIYAGFGVDYITNTGNITSQNNVAIEGDSGNDIIANSGDVNGNGTDISAGSGNDTVMLQDGAQSSADNRLVVNGGTGTDQLVFNFSFHNPDELNAMAQQIAARSPAGGSITFRGQVYAWTNFEQLVNLLQLIITQPSFTDGRLNAYEPWQTAAVYCEAQGGVKVLAIDANSQGQLAFSVDWATVQNAIAQAVNSGANTQIASGLGHSLWALSDGRSLQVNQDDGAYYFTFLAERCAAPA